MWSAPQPCHLVVQVRRGCDPLHVASAFFFPTSGVTMPAKLDDGPIFEHFKVLDLTQSKEELSRQLGIAERSLRRLIQSWEASGIIELVNNGPGRVSGMRVVDHKVRQVGRSKQPRNIHGPTATLLPKKPITVHGPTANTSPKQPRNIHGPTSNLGQRLASQDGTSAPHGPTVTMTSQTRCLKSHGPTAKNSQCLARHEPAAELTSQNRTRASASARIASSYKATASASRLASLVLKQRTQACAGRVTQSRTGMKGGKTVLFHSSSGEKMLPRIVRLHALRLPPADVERIMNGPMLGRHREAMLDEMLHVFIKKYKMRWSATHEASPVFCRLPANHVSMFNRAVLNWIHQYVLRGLTMDQFLQAAEEMCPRNLKYPTPSMMAGGFLAERIAEWMPHTDRPMAKYPTWQQNGMTWIDLGGEDGPVPIVN